MTSSFEFHTYPARLSDAERDKALKVLHDGVAMGRLSHDTFIRRMELALAARRSEDLVPLTADLPTESRLSRLLFGSVEAVSGFTSYGCAGPGRPSGCRSCCCPTRATDIRCASAATPPTGCG